MVIQLNSSPYLPYCRSSWRSDDVIVMGVNLAIPWNKVKGWRRKCVNSFNKRNGSLRNRVQACGKYLGSGFDQIGENGRSGYHPFEEILDSESPEVGEGRLTPAETSRTIIEVNSEATLMFSSLISDEVHENIFWPDLPYLTDEYGNVYFQVNNDEDILQTLTSDNNYVQVIIGLDAKEMLGELEVPGPAAIDFGIEEIDEVDNYFGEDGEEDGDDDYEGDWANVLEVEDDEADSVGSLGDWANLETMRFCHPMYFARKIAEVASDHPVDFMEQPPAGLVIQGLLLPAFIEEHSVMPKHSSSHSDTSAAISKVEEMSIINGRASESASSDVNSEWTEDMEKDNDSLNGTAFYKLEIIKIQLISACGNPAAVDIEKYKKACPDAIAYSAAKILSRVNAGGEKTTNAFKSLCWRCNGLRVEEASLIAIDAVGFDLRVCSGTQVQTLRFAFSSRATSEYSAERQLNELLFPRSNQKMQKQKQAR